MVGLAFAHDHFVFLGWYLKRTLLLTIVVMPVLQLLAGMTLTTTTLSHHRGFSLAAR